MPPPSWPPTRRRHSKRKPLWQKLIVIFAGPAMNLLLPVAIYTGILAVGFPQADSVIGEVEADSPAAAAGLRPNDRVTAIDGTRVQWWRQINDAFVRSHERRARDPVRARWRGGDRAPIRSNRASGRTSSGISSRWVGWVSTTAAHRRWSLLTDRARFAYRAGLRTGDRVTEVAGEPVADWYAFADAYAAAGHGGEVSIALVRGREISEEVTLQVPALGDLESLGVIRADVLIAEVDRRLPGRGSRHSKWRPDSACRWRADAQLRVVCRFGPHELTARPSCWVFCVTVKRSRLSVTPALVQTDLTGFGIEVPRYRIGIVGNNLLAVPGSIGFEQILNPLVAVPYAAAMTVEITRLFIRGLGKLITGDVPRNQLAGAHRHRGNRGQGPRAGVGWTTSRRSS